MAYQIGGAKNENIQSVVVNHHGDEIKINASDASMREKYNQFMTWLIARQEEVNAVCEEKEKQFEGREAIRTNDDGTVYVDVEQLSAIFEIQNSFCRDVINHVDGVFGQDIVKKYFRDDFDMNPDFVPDDDQVIEFINEVTDVASEIYNMRKQRINAKYSKSRKKK